MSTTDDDQGPLPSNAPPPSDAPPPPDAPPPFIDDPGGDSGGLGPRQGLTLPHSFEAEREVLAAIFVDPASFDTVRETLEADDFYHERHGLVYSAMSDLSESGHGIDPVTIQQRLKDLGQWERVGGARIIGELLERGGTTAHLEHYRDIVTDKAAIRRMVEAARQIEASGLQDIADPEQFLDESEKLIFAVLENRASARLEPVGEVMVRTLVQIQNAVDADGDVTGVGTGFRDFDHITHGLQPGDLVVVAARPAMGKTSWVLNLAANAALLHDKAVAFFSLEMPSEQLAQRLLCAEARVDLGRLRGGHLGDDEWPRLTAAADRLSAAPIFLDDTPGASPTTIRAKCRRLKRSDRLDLVIIDYLQLMSGGQKGQRSREQEISYISRSLKGLAKELNAPVVALSQLNRGVESRADKRPLMSDLRESGAIEQDADMICFIYREEVYNKDIEESQRGIAELIVGKHRNGATGTVKLKFWHAHTRFDNLAHQMEP